MVLGSSEHSDDADVPHSVAGFIVQLSRPSARVRVHLTDRSGVDEALAALCTSRNPQLKQDGIRLLRALGKDCPVNQERFKDLAASVTSQGGEGTAPRIEEVT